MSDAARASMLAAIRTALADADAPLPEAHGSASATSDVAVFAERAAAAGARVHRAADDAAAGGIVEAIAAELGASTIAWSDTPRLAGLRSASRLPAIAPEDREALRACALGVTAVQAAIAETGTLVLAGGERHRLVSLLPDVHLAIVDARQIVATLGAGLAVARGAGQPPATVTLITGPSRTADIELQLVVGVHGPRALHIVIVGGPSG
jgi:L-lactate dehydrogenase complex protein LldG